MFKVLFADTLFVLTFILEGVDTVIVAISTNFFNSFFPSLVCKAF